MATHNASVSSIFRQKKTRLFQNKKGSLIPAIRTATLPPFRRSFFASFRRRRRPTRIRGCSSCDVSSRERDSTPFGKTCKS